MSQAQDHQQPDNGFYVLVTGANSGLGLGIGARLIDEFLQTRPQDESLVLIVTTRDRRKGDATIERLQEHLCKVCLAHEEKVPGISGVLRRRIHLRQERLDLLRLDSVLQLAKRLRHTIPKLDVVICNAGIGGWTGINWPLAIFKVLTHMPTAVTFPTFKKSGFGWVAKPQIVAETKTEEPPLGEVFCANLFGHYVLGHHLVPLMARHPKSTGNRGRIIWVSSLEAYQSTFDVNDIQGILSKMPYESSKRLTDIMAITSRLPSTSSEVTQYLRHDKAPEPSMQPRIYTAHPGICGTAIITLPLILEYLMFAVFFIARWMGSQWHTITVEKGAVSMVWLALAKDSTLEQMEKEEGIGKWGSATDFWGQERVERAEVGGWGWGGKLGEYKRKGRDPYAQDLTEKCRAQFEELGKQCWEKMEALRIEWEGRLRTAGVGC